MSLIEGYVFALVSYVGDKYYVLNNFYTIKSMIEKIKKCQIFMWEYREELCRCIENEEIFFPPKSYKEFETLQLAYIKFKNPVEEKNLNSALLCFNEILKKFNNSNMPKKYNVNHILMDKY